MAVSLIVVALAACGSAAPSTPAASPPAPSGSVATTPEPSGAATAPTACYSLNAADCQRAAEAALASLDPGGPAAIYLSVGPLRLCHWGALPDHPRRPGRKGMSSSSTPACRR